MFSELRYSLDEVWCVFKGLSGIENDDFARKDLSE